MVNLHASCVRHVISEGCVVRYWTWLRVYVSLLCLPGVSSLVRLAYSLGIIIACAASRSQNIPSESGSVPFISVAAGFDMVNMNLLRSLLKAGGGHFDFVASIAAAPSPTVVPVAVDTAPAYSPFEVHENSPEEAIRKVPEFSGKHPAEASSGRRKKSKIYGRHKSRRRDERSRPQAN
ncbi:hypothetical protein BHE74_00033255 [Ensete ventricosum]|nr:hypothetical protein GW17_00037485 [Ensete ventricosum]RWW59788.1 hypothetical protein BHE74_00033255 [Ensete ventricosum]